MRALFFITVLFLFACNTPTQQAPAAAANITAVASTKQVFTCGATTKSGNPCQRKVSERGAKCYQHDTPATAANITAVASTKQAPAAAANITAVASTKQVFTCGATTKSGNPCQRKVSERGAKCYQHDTPATAANITAVASTKQAPATASVQQCEGMTKKGERCKNKQKAVFCHLHSK